MLLHCPIPRDCCGYWFLLVMSTYMDIHWPVHMPTCKSIDTSICMCIIAVHMCIDMLIDLRISTSLYTYAQFCNTCGILVYTHESQNVFFCTWPLCNFKCLYTCACSHARIFTHCNFTQAFTCTGCEAGGCCGLRSLKGSCTTNMRMDAAQI